jgi:hypothetical protein
MGSIGDILENAFNVIRVLWPEWRQKNRLRAMLNDKRFPKGFRSTQQLMNGIGADRPTTERLLLAINARRSENSDEWTLKPFPTS